MVTFVLSEAAINGSQDAFAFGLAVAIVNLFKVVPLEYSLCSKAFEIWPKSSKQVGTGISVNSEGTGHVSSKLIVLKFVKRLNHLGLPFGLNGLVLQSWGEDLGNARDLLSRTTALLINI